MNSFSVKKYLFKEQLYVFFKFYKKKKFILADLSLLFFSFFYNPYRVSRKFLKKRFFGKNIYAYGETPLSTMEKIIKYAGICSKDTILDLGAGRGKVCFWLSCFLDCKVYGIEQVPLFSYLGKIIVKVFKIKNLIFLNKDMLAVGKLDAKIAYLYGINLTKQEILKLVEHYKYIDTFITISFALSDYIQGVYRISDKFLVSFPWGTAHCYINKKIFI